MQNNLSNYVGKELKDAVSSLQVVRGTSKEGNTYYCIQLEFINGFPKRIFLKQDEVFAWTNAFDMIDMNKQINVNFDD